MISLYLVYPERFLPLHARLLYCQNVDLPIDEFLVFLYVLVNNHENICISRPQHLKERFPSCFTISTFSYYYSLQGAGKGRTFLLVKSQSLEIEVNDFTIEESEVIRQLSPRFPQTAEETIRFHRTHQAIYHSQ